MRRILANPQSEQPRKDPVRGLGHHSMSIRMLLEQEKPQCSPHQLPCPVPAFRRCGQQPSHRPGDHGDQLEGSNILARSESMKTLVAKPGWRRSRAPERLPVSSSSGDAPTRRESQPRVVRVISFSYQFPGSNACVEHPTPCRMSVQSVSSYDRGDARTTTQLFGGVESPSTRSYVALEFRLIEQGQARRYWALMGHSNGSRAASPTWFR